jgi:hypothetical protein
LILGAFQAENAAIAASQRKNAMSTAKKNSIAISVRAVSI